MREDSFSGPVFVVGIWRSGTSLLYSLLNQHPQLSLMYESDLLLLPALFRNGHSRVDWKQRWDLLNDGFSRHRLETKSLPDDLPDMATAMEVVGRAYAGSAMWGCKSPSYYDRLEELADMFPQARFIIIWRDPAGTCRSIARAAKKSGWFNKNGILVRALLGNREMKRGCDALLARGCCVHQMQYEELVRDPASNMQAVCDFLGIVFDTKMLSLEGADRSAIFEAEHHSMVKTGKIVVQAARPEVLPAPVLRKIERYVNYWKRESGGKWPLYPKSTEIQEEPSALELARDAAAFKYFRTWDGFVGNVFSVAPMSMLNAYRKLKWHMQPAERKVQPAQQTLTPTSEIETRQPVSSGRH